MKNVAGLTGLAHSLRTHRGILSLERPRVMGILNVTPDSFYSGSRCPAAEEARQRVAQIRDEGADIIDIGGYSTRPGAPEVTAEEEYSRLCVGLEAVRELWPEAVVSVDTFRADVAAKCVREWGADIVNDVAGGTLDPEMWPAVAELGCAYILMHMRGTPSTMQTLTDYSDVTADVLSDLAFKADKLHAMGVADVIADPGFGFAKTVEQNYRLLDDLEVFRQLGLPLLAALSRKSMIWRPLGITPEESLPGTVALDAVALLKGADLIRVHDVRAAVETVKLLGMLPSRHS